MAFTHLSILILIAAYIENAAGATTTAPGVITTQEDVYTTEEELTTGIVSTTIDYSDDTPWFLRMTFLLSTAGVVFLLGIFFAVMGCRAFFQAKCPKYCPDEFPDPLPEKKKKKKGDKTEETEKKKKKKVEPKWMRSPPSWLEESDDTKVWIDQPPSWMANPDPMNPQPPPSYLDNPPAWMRNFEEEEEEEIDEDSPDYIPPDDNAPRPGQTWDD